MPFTLVEKLPPVNINLTDYNSIGLLEYAPRGNPPYTLTPAEGGANFPNRHAIGRDGKIGSYLAHRFQDEQAIPQGAVRHNEPRLVDQTVFIDDYVDIERSVSTASRRVPPERALDSVTPLEETARIEARPYDAGRINEVFRESFPDRFRFEQRACTRDRDLRLKIERVERGENVLLAAPRVRPE